MFRRNYLMGRLKGRNNIVQSVQKALNFLRMTLSRILWKCYANMAEEHGKMKSTENYMKDFRQLSNRRGIRNLSLKVYHGGNIT